MWIGRFAVAIPEQEAAEGQQHHLILRITRQNVVHLQP